MDSEKKKGLDCPHRKGGKRKINFNLGRRDSTRKKKRRVKRGERPETSSPQKER